MPKTPYINWTLEQLESHLLIQAKEFGIPENLVSRAIYDSLWNPLKQYNGCNFVQDNLHPFLPCFIHDWRWLCFEYSKAFDIEFKKNLIKSGFKHWKAEVFYIMVRLGYLCFYKWKK